ncbi:hypothetical protein H4219_003456 [Mycoemilia scoparia]|uniref:Uncharacterized protein n=1 Tax=Mycoemilia scoparia TaxID=417184 RepID=A0A9W8DTB7_9FUNG|nr:hypothetical protein H4219_003456 [Mycoemilia scoparia]
MIELLILGQGFIGKYVSEYCSQKGTSFESTTRDGRDNTVKWALPENDQKELCVDELPIATSILITFPVKDPVLLDHFVSEYTKHCSVQDPQEQQQQQQQEIQWIYLGSTRGFTQIPSNHKTIPDKKADLQRLQSEEMLMTKHNGCVLNLAGLWGGQREPKNWAQRFKTADSIRRRISNRTLHLVHGQDVAQAIVDHLIPSFTPNKRWLLSDGRVYDMLEVIVKCGSQDILANLQNVLYEEKDLALCHLGTTKIEDIKFGPEASLVRRIDPDDFFVNFGFKPSIYFNLVS